MLWGGFAGLQNISAKSQCSDFGKTKKIIFEATLRDLCTRMLKSTKLVESRYVDCILRRLITETQRRWPIYETRRNFWCP
jgi:hypothetical protein